MKTMIAKALAVGAVALATAGGVAGAADGYCGTPYPGVFTQGPAPRAGVDPTPFQTWHVRAGVDPEPFQPWHVRAGVDPEPFQTWRVRAGIDPTPFRAPALGSRLGARAR